MAEERRRVNLGSATSAAMPLLWSLLAEHGGTPAKLAAYLSENSGSVSRLLYGDRKAGRSLSLKLRQYGIPIESWEADLPVGWTLPPPPDRESAPDANEAPDADESGDLSAMSDDTTPDVTVRIRRTAGG